MNEELKETLKEFINANSKDAFEESLISFLYQKSDHFSEERKNLSGFKDDLVNEIHQIGKMQLHSNGISYSFIITTLHITKELTERTSKKQQFEVGKNIIKRLSQSAMLDLTGGFFIFYDDKLNYRWSLIYQEPAGRKVTYNPYKRYTYYISRDQTNKTLLQQLCVDAKFNSLEDIKSAFSVEKVTKEFYNEIANWYFWAMDKIKFPEDYKYANDPKKDTEIRNATNLIRLITRIIFIWFLKEKKLIPDTIFVKDEIKKKVINFGKEGNYYNAILQNLFFATLNQKMNERNFAEEDTFLKNTKEYGVKTLYRYADKFSAPKNEVLNLFSNIPFINGGLFDCLDKEDETGKVIYIDGFSRNPKKRAFIPDYLFFQDNEQRVNLTQYGIGSDIPVRGLIEILKNYNFTTDESTPIDQEIALDPELLGKVFENLLASYNPETSTTARKATGSYYTPREIVDYMVEESLFQYLLAEWNVAEPSRFLSSTGSQEASATKYGVIEKLRALLSYSDDIPQFTEEEKLVIISAIDKIKILDPACGSGAFPMGILQKLVRILQKLDPNNDYWYELQYQKALKASEEVFKEKDKADREEILKEINDAFDESINYPDYARKLYLIENCIYGVDIQPIAIQISKLRFFISLILDQKVDKGKENFGIRPLPNLETKFVCANTLIGLEKPDTMFYTDEIKNIEKEMKELRHKYFTAKTRKEKIRLQNKDKKLREKLREKLKETGFSSEASEKIASFDLFDQNASADWFDPEWMFGIFPSNRGVSAAADGVFTQGGFDIVIGNPPYVRQESILKKDAIIKSISKTFTDKNGQSLLKINKRSDLYIYFYYKGLSLLKPNGVFCFINSNSWLDVGYGTELQEFLLKYMKPLLIVDNIAERSFDADINTVIVLIQKPQDAISNDDIIKFVAFKKRFSEILNSDTLNQIHQAKDKIINENYRLIPKTRKELWIEGIETEDEEIYESKLWNYKYIGNKWGGKYLRAPEIFFKILEKPIIVELRTVANILGGIITGNNSMYYSPIKRPLTKGYEECFKSPKEIKKILVKRLDAKTMIKNSNVPFLIKKSSLLWPDLRGDVHIVHRNTDTLAFEHNFYGVEAKQIQDNFKLCLILNSTISALCFEVLTRTGLGGGAGRLVKTDIKRFPIISPRYFSVDVHKFNPFLDREILSIFEELGFQKCRQRNCKHPEHPYEYVKPEEVSFDRIMPDRRELDKIVFEALGLTEEEQLEVYRAVLELVKNRLLKAKSR